MKILMLSWEYPPRNVGGISEHVYNLSQNLSKKGVEVSIITCNENGLPEHEKDNRVNVYRAIPYDIATGDFIRWVFQLNMSLNEKAVTLVNNIGEIDLIHAHDWIVGFAARSLKHIYNIPMITTIHATEHGRNHGLHNEMQGYISNVEWWLTYEAWRVICCSKFMYNELRSVFQLPEDKINIVPNGVNILPQQDINIRMDFRRKYANDDEKIIFFVGRLVREKGVQVLLEALHNLLNKNKKVKLIVAGKGPFLENLKNAAWNMGIYNKVYFIGYVDDETKNGLYNVSDVAVFPSLYEPFGIVALEAMERKIPLIVSNAGGLGEIVTNEVDGIVTQIGNSEQLTHALNRIIDDRGFASKLVENAYKKIGDQFTWDHVAAKTYEIYQEVINQHSDSTEKQSILIS